MKKQGFSGRRMAVIALGFLAVFLGYRLFFDDGVSVKDVSYSQFMSAIDAGKISHIDVSERERILEGREKDGGGLMTTRYVGTENIAEVLRGKGVDVAVVVQGGGWWDAVKSFLWLCGGLLVLWFLIRFAMRMMGPSGQAGSFTKSKAQKIDPKEMETRFTDVLGADEAVESVRETVAFLKDPERFAKLGGKIPKNTLFVGPPGTGKTLLARAIAGEAGVPFLSIGGSDFVEMFVGVGAARMRALFKQARAYERCIIFIDEVDAIARQRGAGVGGGHDEREHALNQMLVEMDGLKKDSGILIIAATNRPDVLDPAFLRRFNRQVVMPTPDLLGRIAILEHCGRGVVLDPKVDFTAIAGMTAGLSGDALTKLVNEAALLAGRHEHAAIEQSDFEEAFEKSILGEMRKLLMTDKDKRRTAVHETGHTFLMLEDADSGDLFHKVTIIPRGMTLGVTMSRPTQDIIGRTERQLWADVDTLLAGHAAEILVFGECSTGASNDLQRSTDILKAMAGQYGMSEEIGPVGFGGNRSPVFLGRDVADQDSMSKETAYQIEFWARTKAKVRREFILGTLKKRRKAFDAVVERLIVRETLTRDEVLEIIASAEAED